ncbi:MAG: hypothetical protein P8M61_01480 [Crocinitomicaceae bacterium]|jgi:hypothetical protein|nr:hypothetical protein [Crocinitomicaceae bacterium]MDG1858505.1 hypothetical protein [Emcibacteraceae bacterium]MDG2463735.1 hypothetical protein [Crocinitomicaceae bacterium]
MTLETLIKAKYVGELDNTFVYSTLGFQTIAVLVGGIVLWRVSNAMHKKKLQQRAGKEHFKTRFSEHMKNR